MPIVMEQFSVVTKLFLFLRLKLALNLNHQVSQLVRDVCLSLQRLLATVEHKAVAMLELILLPRELAVSQHHEVLCSASDLVEKMSSK